MDNKLECPICLGPVHLPVVTQCGHIFCWNCIKDWLQKNPIKICPICKNCISLDKMVSLFLNNDCIKPNEIDDRPKAERIEPQNNRGGFRSFFRNLWNAFGLYGYNNNNNSNNSNGYNEAVIPDRKEVIRNRLSLVVFLFAIVSIVYIFRS